jgi:hypothetical protein
MRRLLSTPVTSGDWDAAYVLGFSVLAHGVLVYIACSLLAA